MSKLLTATQNEIDELRSQLVTRQDVMDILNNFTFTSLKIKGQNTDDTYCVKLGSDGNLYIEKETTQDE